MAKQITATPVPSSAFYLGKTSPYGEGFFLPIYVKDEYSPKHQYLIKITGGHLPADAPISLYGGATSLVNGKPALTYYISNEDAIKPGDTISVSGASMDANGNYTAFGDAKTIVVPNS